MNNFQYPLVEIKTVSGENGSLSFFEILRDLDFDIKRIFYVYGVKAGTVRGGHAHKEATQFLFCPYGKIKVKYDDGSTKSDFILDNPAIALYVKPGVWLDTVWLEDNSVLCVATSDYYSEMDYIRDYDEYSRWLK